VPSGPRRDAQPLDDRERLVTLEPPDDPPERAGKPPNIVVEWEIFCTSWRREGKAFHRAINLPDFGLTPNRATQ